MHSIATTKKKKHLFVISNIPKGRFIAMIMIKESLSDLWLPKIWELEIFWVSLFQRFET